jgi:hypothetical protein
MEAAVGHLLQSADIKAQPPFTFAGPPMRFAYEMLEHGQRDAVLAFFDACSKFWTMRTEILELWRDDVRAGRMPRFGWKLDH